MNNFGVMYCTYDRPRAVIRAGRQLNVADAWTRHLK